MPAQTLSRPRTAQQGQAVRHTKIPTVVFENSRRVDRHVALVIESLIRENNSAGEPTVLGLPTGSTPIGVYRELIRLHEEEDLDFSNVVTFNLDEYLPMDPGSIHSYHRFMRENFFDHVNVPEENVHIPKGNVPLERVDAYCDEYEREIDRVGGIDIQLLGIGRTGHIGFNEPGSDRSSRTRMATLDPVTRLDAASGFFGEENVPFQAITMGVGTILRARKVMLIALGEHKARIVRQAVEEEVTPHVTASFLQAHPQATFLVDHAAAAELTAIKTPWLVGRCEWTPELEKRAVIWLSQQEEKPLSKLEARDFYEHRMHDLLKEHGPPETIRERVFENMQATICTKPAGDERRSIVCFSPHPDDDVISMGGTLCRLTDQGHDVHIAYMTSGNIAVFDHDALRHADYVQEYLDMFGLACEESRVLDERVRAAIERRRPGDPDSPEALMIKGLVRKTEATAGAKVVGVEEDHLRFLDLPFYRTGEVKKKPIGDEDVAIVADLLRELRPDQIYVAGDLSDPHGTHRMCAHAIIKALAVVEAEGQTTETWLYRGAWQEYEPHEIERAVPLSPETVLRKKMAIFKHESQKDRALYPGHDAREFWVRAEHRTKNTARIYNDLGLPEFYAIEGFVKFKGQL
jgi:glucosamine-6-phosphate deaminase